MPETYSRLPLFFALVAAALHVQPAALRAEPFREINVGVRADVEWIGTHKPTEDEIQQAREHQRVYVIASVKQVPAADKMVRPMNEQALVDELRRVLAQNGYREARPDQRPEIVLIVFYGRGWLPNPYLGDTIQDTDGNYVPTMQQVMKERQPGYEEKLQRAGYEKLMISVTALRFPSKPREKPQRLWKTIMNVDDPDHRDLNGVFQKMLAAGGAFFGRQVAKEEAEVWQPLPEGHVKLGPTTVIEEKKPAPK